MKINKENEASEDNKKLMSYMARWVKRVCEKRVGVEKANKKSAKKVLSPRIFRILGRKRCKEIINVN